MEKNGNYLLENSKTYKSDLSWIDRFYNDAAMRIINDLLTPQLIEMDGPTGNLFYIDFK